MGGARDTYGEQVRCAQGFGGWNLWVQTTRKAMGTDHSKGLGIDGRLILKWIFRR